MRQRHKAVNNTSINTSEEEEIRHSKSDFLLPGKIAFVLCLVIRIVNALLLQTYFNPDEHWQALEVAHRIAFGYGHLTWEWEKGIRSYLHPMLFSLLYKILAFLHLDTPLFMIKSPRLLQSFFSAVGDLYLYKFSHVLFGDRVAKWALFSQLANWFMFFCFNRTFSNSLETVLTLVGLYYWPSMRVSSNKDPSVSRKLGLVFAALACAIRPTSAITWFYVGLLELVLARDRMKFVFLEAAPIGHHMRTFVKSDHSLKIEFLTVTPVIFVLASATYTAMLTAETNRANLHNHTQQIVGGYLFLIPYTFTRGIRVLVLGLTCLLDRLMYGSWVLVPLNFLKFNFLSSGGDYYGTHKWHWYFTQGFTVMVFSFLPFSIAGIIKSKHWKLSGLILWVLGLYSVLGHKEFRFVLPVLPVALIFSGYSLAVMEKADYLDSKRKGSLNTRAKWCSKTQFAIFFLLVTNIPMALYMSMVHQRGTEDVMNYLSKEALNEKVKSIIFLMPCHATPYYSTLHRNLPMRFLDCSPREERGTLDESDHFMNDPVGFTSEIAKNGSLPSHIVLFGSEEIVLRDLLKSYSFREIRRFFHAHFKVDRDLQASVVVYTLNGE